MHVLFEDLLHAGTAGTSIAWLRRAGIPSGPQRISLPASARPSLSGEFDLEARALLATSWRHGHHPGGQALLLVTARVIEDHGQGAWPWLSELEMHLNAEGLGDSGLMAGGECDWALRIGTGHPQWIALRTGQHEDGTPRHLLLSALELPGEWAEAAHRDGQVTVAIGACTAHWDDITPVRALVDELDGLPGSPAGITSSGAPARCACAAITAGHVADLAAAGVLVTAGVRVVTAAGPA